MNDQVTLVSVAEDDLALLHRLTSDPSATGDYEWRGWQNPWIFRRRWEEKAGFTREGVIRGAAFRGGRWHDGVLYSVLRDEIDLDNR